MATAPDTRIEAAQDFLQHCLRGMPCDASPHLDPEVEYHVPGSHKLAGSFRGTDAVARRVAALLETTHRTFDIVKWDDGLAGENHLATSSTSGFRDRRGCKWR